MQNSDEVFMRRALELAKNAWGNTAPNPMVGAVLVCDGVIIGEGWHTRDGAPHAEIECIKDAKKNGALVEGATMYVTLEPCTTRGRTGACSQAIIAEKISSVKIGATDPNPEHSGRAAKVFADAHIDCQFGILERECTELNFIFNHCITTRRALLALKYAVSADGKIAEVRGRPSRITGDLARENLMRWRRLFSSIGVGKGTLLSDNPRLTSRISSGSAEKTSSGLRLLFNSDLSLADCADIFKYNLFSDEFAGSTAIVHSANANAARIKFFQNAGVKLIPVPANPFEDPCGYWDYLKRELFQMRATSLMLEGGAKMFACANRAKAADFAFEYRSSKNFGSGLDAFAGGANFKFENPEIEKLGVDTLSYGKISYLR